MAELTTILQITLVLAAVTVPAVLLALVLRGDDSGSIADLWVAPDRNAWPRGVQEGEPVRFNLGAV